MADDHSSRLFDDESPAEPHEHVKGASDAHVEIVEPFAIIPQALLCDPDVDDGMVRVYGVLVRHGSDPSNCYPSHRRIGELTGKSPRTIPAIIARLVESGWVEVVPRLSEAGDHNSNGYRVHQRAPERGVYASARRPLPARERGGSTRERAPKESKEKESHLKETRAGSRSARPEPGRARVSKTRDVARMLLDEWWERQDPRPRQNYVGAVRVIEGAIADWGEERVRAALDKDPPVISGGALQVAAASGNGRGRGHSLDQPLHAADGWSWD